MKVLVVDSGGRGHAIAWQFKNDPNVTEVICTPGNFGIAKDVRCEPSKTNEDVVALAKREKVDLVFVGPEGPLSKGLIDLLLLNGIMAVGPVKMATDLEGSKANTKLLCREIGVPCPEFEVFDEPKKAKDYIYAVNHLVVVKADGLAQGKGSLVCNNQEQAIDAVNQIMINKDFGDAGNRVVIEKRLYGTEISFFVFTDGKNLSAMPVAQDYKRAYDSDEGLNTGGMGSYSPHRLEGAKLSQLICDKVALPLIHGYHKKYNVLYKGIFYCGIMLVDEVPNLLEINVRFGDPEAEVILPRLITPLSEVSRQIIEGNIGEIQWSDKYFCDVVATQGRTHGSKGWYKGYPERYGKGYPITGIEDVEKDPKCKIFFAGVNNHETKGMVTDGGRVLHIVGEGATLEDARNVAYRNIEKIQFEGIRYRGDIGR
jgi:phosphoribosylamine---glycine ligase